ncbi:DUF4132 domain-containing protein [Pseudomarimonas arenosa]|uniref:DUF4132 domain-containing protein n=1 Tax=Pseudomarimonas arenosa TaxID=2774145 RepID=A0AAW3ZGX9_9GAMM|nr:DUF4132 domain-containing protein [Pseudomarimonas arenosa]MBD8524690.1 DUF4132 domain-containing protein [Pseudomarimonas arenosa]
MRRFELVEGTSSKFWEISLEGSSYTVRYGRIGTNGQTLTKTAASDAKAEAEVTKLIKEKTGKGYTEVAVAAGATLAAVTPKPAVSQAKPSKPATQDPAAADDEPAKAAAASADPQSATSAARPEHPVSSVAQAQASTAMPDGQLRLSSGLRRLMPAQRGYELSASSPSEESLLLQLGKIAAMDPQRSYWEFQYAGLNALIKESPFSALFTQERLRPADPASWLSALRIALALQDHYDVDMLKVLLTLCARWHGLAFTVRHFLQAVRGSERFQERLSFEQMAALLATCTPEEYDGAKAEAALIVPTGFEKIARAAIFNTESDWIAEGFDAARTHANAALGLTGVRLTLPQAEELAKSSAFHYYGAHSAATRLALNLAREHGPAAARLIVSLYDSVADSDRRRRLAEVLGSIHCSEALAELLERIEHKEVRPQLDEFAQSWPYASMQAAAEHCARTRSKPVETWLSRLLAAHPELIDPLQETLQDGALELLKRLLKKLVNVDEAPLEALPSVLRDPPWLKPQPKQQRPELPEVPMPAPRIQWPEGLREEWQRRLPANGAIDPDSNKQKGRMGEALDALSVPRSLWPGILSGRITDLGPHMAEIDAHWAKLQSYHRYRYLQSLVPLAPQFRLLLWNSLPGWDAYTWEGSPTVGSLIAHYQLDALPGLLNFVGSRLEAGLAAALPVAAADIATFAAQGLSSKKARPHAVAWLRAHAELATSALLLQSARATKKAAEQADAALRWLAANVEPERMQTGAGHFGEAGLALLQAILSVDPLALLPQKPRALPSFYLPAGFARPRLPDGRALPAEALATLGTMLQVSLPDEPYAGLEQIRSTCTAESLDEFAWDLFQAWYQAGAPSKEGWAFTAMGAIGGEHCVRQLTPLIREWPGQSQHARAVTGLDVLAGIGSDLALMNLNGIAQKAKFKGLQERAKEKIQAIAEARDLTAEELADRLVPDLDLEADGTLHLDFGSRQFTVGFDEHLRPFARDASGARLKDLPKPNKTDDAELAKAASERWKLLKKDAKSIANHQLQRLEQIMCTGRSFELPVFEQFLLHHPLMRHLARRLLWGVVQADGSVRGFRIAEDSSYADSEDMQFVMPADARICLPHPLKLSAEEQAGFGQIFADYEILQPFVQLGREVLQLSEEELTQSELTRFQGKRVAIGSVYGLQHRGWRHGSPQDAGWIGWFEKSLPNGLEAHIELDPGTAVGDIRYESKQSLGKLSLRVVNSWDNNGLRPFATLDPVVRSELLRDLDRLAVLVD